MASVVQMGGTARHHGQHPIQKHHRHRAKFPGQETLDIRKLGMPTIASKPALVCTCDLRAHCQQTMSPL